jgi:DNA-directed RNA polymerase specialized sigma24 family protein
VKTEKYLNELLTYIDKVLTIAERYLVFTYIYRENMAKISQKKGKSRDFTISELDKDFEKFKKLYEELKKKYGAVELISKAEEKEILMPATIFSKKLSPLEAISKFLRENVGLSIKEIAKPLNRSEKTIWQAYNSSRKKHPKLLKVIETKYFIPISKLANRRYSAFESIVSYLKSKFELSYHEIAVLLNRDDRTIWTLHHRAKAKRGKA